VPSYFIVLSLGVIVIMIIGIKPENLTNKKLERDSPLGTKSPSSEIGGRNRGVPVSKCCRWRTLGGARKMTSSLHNPVLHEPLISQLDGAKFNSGPTRRRDHIVPYVIVLFGYV